MPTVLRIDYLGVERAADVVEDDLLCFTEAVVRALNHGYGCSGSAKHGRGNPTVGQLAVLRLIASRATRLVARLASEPSPHTYPVDVWSSLQARATEDPLQMLASLVDCPAAAATCDPLSVVGTEFGNLIRDAGTMFANAPPGLEHFSGFYAGQRAEFVALLVRQLRCGKSCLRKKIKGGGTVFVVAKSDGIKQREVFHGSRVSEAASTPLPPLFLASPASFRLIELDEGRQLRMSKRDGTCFFDQLLLPEQLQEWMARPPVSVGELVGAGFSEREMLGYCVGFTPSFGRQLDRDDPGDDRRFAAGCSSEWVWPCSRVWGMGFSWSSCVAQETLLCICARAGLDERHVLAPGHP